MTEIETSPAHDNDRSVTPEPTRQRRSPKSLDEQLEEAVQKAALLRQKRSEQQRKTRERLVQLVGSTVLTMLEQDAVLRATLVPQLLTQVTRAADRELLHQCLVPDTV